MGARVKAAGSRESRPGVLMMIGNLVKEMQNRKNVSAAELARRINTTPQQLSRWRNQGDLRVTTLLKICSALGVEEDELASLLSNFNEAAQLEAPEGQTPNEQLQQFFKQTREGEAEGPRKLGRVLSSAFGHHPVTGD